MNKQFNLLFPEWQGYGVDQSVYHGAHQLCNHLREKLDFNEIEVQEKESLRLEKNVIGRSSLVKMTKEAIQLLALKDPSRLFMVGGTCACEVAPVSFLNRKYDGDLAIFWFDAHGDLNTPDESQSHRMHGMPLRTLLGEGDGELIAQITSPLTVDQVALVGARDLDITEKKYIAENDLPIFRPSGFSHIAELVDFAKTAGFTKAYIHFDLDVLDPYEFPHMLLKVQDGMSLAIATESIKLIRKQFEIVGASIVEYDPKDKTGDALLAQFIKDGMGVHF